MKMINPLAGLALVVVSLAGPSYAQAPPRGASAESELAQATVRYNDLDLGSSAGRNVLKHRVEVAARDVCTVLQFSSKTAGISDPACVRSAMANANAQMSMAIAQRTGAPITVLSSLPPQSGR